MLSLSLPLPLPLWHLSPWHLASHALARTSRTSKHSSCADTVSCETANTAPVRETERDRQTQTHTQSDLCAARHLVLSLCLAPARGSQAPQHQLGLVAPGKPPKFFSSTGRLSAATQNPHPQVTADGHSNLSLRLIESESLSLCLSLAVWPIPRPSRQFSDSDSATGEGWRIG